MPLDQPDSLLWGHPALGLVHSPAFLARGEAGLALEAEAAFGYLGLRGVGFHQVDSDVRTAIWAEIVHPAHLKLPSTPAGFLEVAAILPDCQPCPEIEIRCLFAALPDVVERSVPGGRAS